MVRISKDPKERKSEILNTARLLFMSEGYEKTSVEKIIKALDLAKGTFYYYFKSKADLLEAIASKSAEEHYAIWQSIIQQKELNAVQKFNKVFKASSDLKIRNKKLILAYLQAYMADQNMILRYKLGEHRKQKASEILSEIIVQGNHEGFFHSPYPEDSVLMIFRMAESMAEETFPLIIRMLDDPSYKEEVIRKYEMLEFMAERILGAEQETLKLFDRAMLDQLIEM